MTRALTVVEQAEVKAEWEREREAWNLPRQPVGTDSDASLANEMIGSGPLEAWENERGAELRLSA